MTEYRKFTYLNPSFTCEYCGKFVPEAASTCRNHCPHCLSSKHVDHFPGDRSNECKGELKAIGYEKHKKKGLMLIHQCQKCGEKVRNKALLDDPIQADDYDAILALTPHF